jgi:V/A-type H+-transporting ATPase subunit F
VRYHIIGDEDAVLGFGMVGVPGRAVTTAEEAGEALKAALADGDVGIIIITERIADLVRPTVDRYLFTGRFPLIIEIPDRRGPMEGKLGIREMVNAAIGVRL